jgi:hypothetical protein
MKLRNLLMTAVFVLAVSASFAFKAKSSFAYNYSVIVGQTGPPQCWPVSGGANSCETYYTGPQCTAYTWGATRLMYEYPIPAGPLCVTPLRQP